MRPGETSGRIAVDTRPSGNDHQVEEVYPQGIHGPDGVGYQGKNDHRAGRTGDEDGQERHHEPVLGAFHNAGGHDRRDGAAVAQDEGDDGLAVEAQAVHEVVHEKGYPGQVAAVLQEGQAHQKGQEIRQHNGHAAENPHEQTLTQELVAETAGAQPIPGQIEGYVEISHEEIFAVLANPKNRLEKQAHDEDQDGVAPHPVGSDLVQTVPPPRFGGRGDLGYLLEKVDGQGMALGSDDQFGGRPWLWARIF